MGYRLYDVLSEINRVNWWIAAYFNVFIPIAIILFTPIVINIYGIHIFLFNSFITNGLYMLLICLFLIYRYKKVFKPLFIFRPLADDK